MMGDYYVSPLLMGDYYVSPSLMGDYYVSPLMMGNYYVSPSMMGDYYVSPSLMGRCCFTINSSIFLLPLLIQLFILMLIEKNNKYQSYNLWLDLIRIRTHELPHSTITITSLMTFSPYIYCQSNI
jgi:hypothetical protein